MQAKHAQDELQLTSSQLNQLKSINSAVANNLSETALSNKRLKEELAECKALLDEVRECVCCASRLKCKSHVRSLFPCILIVSTFHVNMLTSHRRGRRPVDCVLRVRL